MGPFPIILIAFLGILVYSNAFHASFHFDDYRYIVDNAAIRNFQDLAAIWHFYPCRFLDFLSFALNYHFSKTSVFGFHCFNLAVHVTTAILVWCFVRLTL